MASVYFAHPYRAWNSPAAARIEAILESMGTTVVNAFNHKETALIGKYGGEYYSSPCREFAEEIVQGDLELLRGSDAYLGWFPDGHACIGSSIELHHAVVHGKHVTVICSQPHPFLHVLANEVYATIDDFEQGVVARLPSRPASV